MHDADIVELHERAKRDANRWRTVFNINPATWKLPRGFIDFVLEKIGYRLLKLSQQRRFTNGKQARLYVIQTRFHGIDCRSIKAHISDNITRRFDQAMADAIGDHHDPACSEQQVSVARFVEAAEKPVIDSNATFSLQVVSKSVQIKHIRDSDTVILEAVCFPDPSLNNRRPTAAT